MHQKKGKYKNRTKHKTGTQQNNLHVQCTLAGISDVCLVGCSRLYCGKLDGNELQILYVGLYNYMHRNS